MMRPWVMRSDTSGSDRSRRPLGRRGIEDVPYFRNTVRGEASPGGMLADHVLVRSDVHTVDRVAGHVAVDPLDPRPHGIENLIGFLRDPAQVLGRERATARDMTL